MQIVQVLAGFSLGQADLLRRAMGKKKHEILMAQKTNFLSGCAKNHIEPGLANTIFDLLTHFADYGFNKSHSAAYALVAWQTAYLKAHYPAEFMAAMLTSIMDTQKVPTYIELCKRMDIQILPPDINASSANFSVDGKAIRFGLAAVRNVGEAAIQDITMARKQDGAFNSLLDFCMRVDMGKVNKRVMESLIKCGAFDSLGAKRSQLLAILDAAVGIAQREQKDAMNGQIGLFGEEIMGDAAEIKLPKIEEVSEAERLEWEKDTTGFYITGHPLDRFRRKLDNLPRIVTLEKGIVEDKQLVRIGGLLLETKRITTKKGETMCFATLEDYTARIEVTVFPRVFYQNVNLLVPDTAVVIQGKIDSADEKVKILADRIWPLKEYLPEYYLQLPDEKAAEKKAALQEIMQAHHGTHTVFLQSGGRWQKLSPVFGLDDSDEVLEKLIALLGDKAVKKR